MNLYIIGLKNGKFQEFAENFINYKFQVLILSGIFMVNS